MANGKTKMVRLEADVVRLVRGGAKENTRTIQGEVNAQLRLAYRPAFTPSTQKIKP